MAWKETTAMEQKIEFINEWRSGIYSITELCRQFAISRPTAYKYIDRFEKEGVEGLCEKSRSHRNHPKKTKDFIEGSIITLREKHPRWGAEKIWKLLQGEYRKEQITEASTIEAPGAGKLHVGIWAGGGAGNRYPYRNACPN